MGERILGVDPGLETTGYGLIAVTGRQPAHLASGTLVTRTDETLAQRVASLYAQFSTLLDELHPHAVALEELYAHYQHPTTAILMGHARGAICLAVAQRRLPLACYLPTRVKKAVTGHGHATKTQVQGMITALLSLSRRPEPDDVSDALALALTHAQMQGHPAMSTRTLARRRTLPPALQAALR